MDSSCDLVKGSEQVRAHLNEPSQGGLNHIQFIVPSLLGKLLSFGAQSHSFTAKVALMIADADR